MSSLRRRGGIFVSYRREETAAYAGRLFDRLSDRFGEESVFMDVDSIAIGTDFTRAIAEAVSGCDILLALIGRDWSAITDGKGRRRIDNPDDFVRVEIETALERDIRVVPILVDGAVLPQVDDLPISLRPLIRRQALEFSHSSFRSDVSRLIAAIDEVIEVEPGRSAPPLEASDRYPQEEWQGHIRVAKVGLIANDTQILVKLSQETHSLVARYCKSRDYLKLDGRQIASSWNSLTGIHKFSMSDGPRQLAAEIQLASYPPDKISSYYKVLRLVVNGQEVPLIEHPV
jgi:hypothetical protein